MAKYKAALKRAVAVIRMSSSQQEASPDQQRAAIAKLAAEHGYKIIREYADLGISGAASRSKRKALDALLHDAKNADFEAVFVYALDRLSRLDSVDAAAMIQPIRQAGLKVISCCEGVIDLDEPMSRMKYMFGQEMASQERINIATRSLRGKIAAAKRGDPQGSIPYGLDKVFRDGTGKVVYRAHKGEDFRRPSRDWTSRYEPSELESADVVRGIFRRFAKGEHSVLSILDDLNVRKIPSPSGGRWAHSALRAMLRNQAYIGHATLGKTATGTICCVDSSGEQTYDVKANRHHWNPSAIKIIVRDAHVALIDVKTFETVQRKMDERAKAGGVRKNGDDTHIVSAAPRKPGQGAIPYFLSGLLYCGCGARMGGRSIHKRHCYYVCTARMRFGKRACQGFTIRKEHIEGYILDQIRRELLSSKNLDRLRKQIESQAREQLSGESLKELKRRLAALDTKIATGTRRIMEAASDMDAQQARGILREWRADRDALTAELAEVSGRKGTNPKVLADAAISRLERLRESLDSADPAVVRHAIAGVVERITLEFKAGRLKPGKGRIQKHHFQRGEVTMFINKGDGNTQIPVC